MCATYKKTSSLNIIIFYYIIHITLSVYHDSKHKT